MAMVVVVVVIVVVVVVVVGVCYYIYGECSRTYAYVPLFIGYYVIINRILRVEFNGCFVAKKQQNKINRLSINARYSQ